MIAASALIVTGCGESGEITMDMSDEKQSVITLKNAGKDMTSTLGTFVVEDNEEVVVEPDLEGDGKIQISLTDYYKIGLIIMDNRKVSIIKMTIQMIGTMTIIKMIGKIKTTIKMIGKTIKGINSRTIIRITIMIIMTIMMTE